MFFQRHAIPFHPFQSTTNVIVPPPTCRAPWSVSVVVFAYSLPPVNDRHRSFGVFYLFRSAAFDRHRRRLVLFGVGLRWVGLYYFPSVAPSFHFVVGLELRRYYRLVDTRGEISIWESLFFTILDIQWENLQPWARINDFSGSLPSKWVFWKLIE